ncbi:MAG: hypothetical protein Q9199_005791 [Rusavskia elegans]
MHKILTFTKLDYDILSIIIDMLQHQSQQSLRNLGCVSRFCKSLVDPVLYRSVELRDKLRHGHTTTKVLFRLLDPTDSLSEYVRDLKVASDLLIDPSKGRHFRNQDTARPSDLERIITRLVSLSSISWDLNPDIPRPILSILEQQWPYIKLSVTNYDCSETNLSLLATPLLHSLRFKATPGPTGTYDKLDGYSKMPELREIMLNAPNLRKLHITFAAYWTNRNAAAPHIIQMPLRPTDRLPPLHELTLFGPSQYV